jgi:diguanylate cyclase (GGDEF)-like protein
LAQKLKSVISQRDIVLGESEEQRIAVSISIGLTWFFPSDKNYSSALARADEAMYRAKKAGKNRSVSIEDDELFFFTGNKKIIP